MKSAPFMGHVWYKYIYVLFKKYFYLFLFLCVTVLPACISVGHLCTWCLWRSAEPSDPLEVELEGVANHRVGAGNQTSVLLTTEPSLKRHQYWFTGV